MTFCSEQQKENEIIEYVEYKDNNYTLYYLDGSEASFINNDKNYLQKLEEKIIEQAKERDKMNIKDLNMDKWKSLIITLASINLTNVSLQKNLLYIAVIGFVLTFCFLKEFKKNSNYLKELKKYKILLENYKSFKNDPEIAKFVEYKPIYIEPVNIFTIDKFSLYEMKIMKKNLKNKK